MALAYFLFSDFLYLAKGIFEHWWWIIVPFVLWFPFRYLWLWWRAEVCLRDLKFIVLEIKIPKEVLRPLKAMEQVFSAFWGNLYDPPDWWEKWIDGKGPLAFSLEIASIGGEAHFFIRIPEASRNAFESTVYSQYPDAEISVVDDYTKYVPQDIPNKNWDLWGSDYELIKDDVYPIKTYSKFFEEKPDAPKEEKRIDPLSTLLEGMSELGPGEQLWIQITAVPVTNEENHYVTRGRAIADKLSKRPAKTGIKEALVGIPGEATKIMISGKTSEEVEEPREIIPPEMKLTPGEREILSGVEGKIGRYAFESNIRFIYLGKREVFFKPHMKTIFGFFAQFSTTNLNAFKPWPKTMTKIHKYPILNIILPRRLFVRKRMLFRNYVMRVNALFPRKGGTFILDIEELATLFHFPGKMVAPAPFMPRVEAKKGEAPPGLPTE